MILFKKINKKLVFILLLIVIDCFIILILVQHKIRVNNNKYLKVVLRTASDVHLLG